MPNRIVTPELLDHLPPDDPMALRSRRDLRRINRLMGNEDWVCQTVRQHPGTANRGITEIGAGDGFLVHKLASLFPAAPVTAYDLAPPPGDLPATVGWHEGDLLITSIPDTGGVLVANLFLHHFEPPQLEALGKWCRNFDLLVINEPDRARMPHLLGGMLHPFINSVTRHDMHVSIDAGFAAGEIASYLRLDSKRWTIHESSSWQGSRRVVASRN